MFSFKKLFASIVASVAIMSASAINVFADDYAFDLSKATRTFGKGTTYVHYTRLDNERMDRNNFNPLWMTKDSSLLLEFEAEGEYENTPIVISFQSWTGEKVTGTEDKIVKIYPSEYTDSTAVVTYDDMVKYYGTDDFSDVYCVRAEDDGNQVLVTSFTVTNCNIPEDEAENAKGTIIKTEETAESTETETEPVAEETAAVTEEAVPETTESNETKAEKPAADENEDVTKISEEPSESEAEENSSNPILIIGIIAGGVIIVIVVVVILVVSKKKKKSKHRFR